MDLLVLVIILIQTRWHEDDLAGRLLAEMEGGVGALGLSSGMAAITYAIFAIAQAGDNIISTSSLYGGTYNLFAHTLPRLGIDVRFVDHNDLKGMEALIDDHTKAIFAESLGNPAGNILDIEAVATMAHKHGVPVIIDNTVPSPYLCRPFEHGADIVVHSLTKYMGGHDHRRRGSRLGNVSLGGTRRSVSNAKRTRSFVPWCGVYRSPGAGRLYRSRARGAATQHGFGNFTVQQFFSITGN